MVQEGGRGYLVSSSVDITEITAAQEAQAASEARFQWTFQNNPDGMCLTRGTDGILLDMNPALERMTGWPREAALGRSTGPDGVNAWAAPEDRQRWVQSLLHHGKVQGFVTRLRRRDGSDFRCEMSGTLLKVKGESCILASLRDISAQHATEAALREQEARLQSSLEGAELGSWDWDLGTGHLTTDARWAELMGYQAGELPPAHHALLQALVHPEDRGRVQSAVQEHLEGRSPAYESEHRLRHRKGHWLWVLDRGRILERDAGGRALRFCGAVQDISARKALQLECQEARARFTALLAALPDLLFVFSRDGRFLDCHAPEGSLLLEPSQFLGRSFDEILDPWLAGRTREAVEAACATDEVQEFEYSLEVAGRVRRFHTRIARVSAEEAVALTREVPRP